MKQRKKSTKWDKQGMKTHSANPETTAPVAQKSW